MKEHNQWRVFMMTLGDRFGKKGSVYGGDAERLAVIYLLSHALITHINVSGGA